MTDAELIVWLRSQPASLTASLAAADRIDDLSRRVAELEAVLDVAR